MLLQTFHPYGVRKRCNPVKFVCRFHALRRTVALVFVTFVASLLLTDRHFQLAGSTSLAKQREDKLDNPQYIAEGAKLFAPSCGNAYCHGAGGVGGGAPRLRGKGLEPAYVFKTISNGIPGSAMLSFKSEFSEQQIWKLVAFITSDAKAISAAKPETPVGDKPASQPAINPRPAEPTAASSLAGSVQAGKALFFDAVQSRSCGACHTFDGEGTPIGPDLSKAGSRSPRELFLNIVLPHETKDPKYATVTLTLRNGDTIRGVKKEEDGESIRVYDTTELPAVLRTVQKTDVAKVETAMESTMPKDYASTYTLKQLLDLVTFLRSSQSGSAVTLKDLFQ